MACGVVLELARFRGHLILWEQGVDDAEDTMKALRTLERDRPTAGCTLMTMHKSKWKEADGVIIYEAPHAPLVAEGEDELASRRLLPVVVMRARHRGRHPAAVRRPSWIR